MTTETTEQTTEENQYLVFSLECTLRPRDDGGTKVVVVGGVAAKFAETAHGKLLKDILERQTKHLVSKIGPIIDDYMTKLSEEEDEILEDREL